MKIPIKIDLNPCMIIIEDGKVIEACMKSGRLVYDTSIAPSFFAGNGCFGARFTAVAKEIWKQTKIGTNADIHSVFTS